MNLLTKSLSTPTCLTSKFWPEKKCNIVPVAQASVTLGQSWQQQTKMWRTAVFAHVGYFVIKM